MRTLLRGGMVALAALGCGWLMLSARADDDDKAIHDGVLKIAAALEKGEKGAAPKLAEGIAKKAEEPGDFMELLSPRKKKKEGQGYTGGFGVGIKPGAITPDGIEQMLISLGRDGRSQAKAEKEAEALEKMAYRIAAVMEVALQKVPQKAVGPKTPKLWITSATTARDAAYELAAAARQKSGAALKAAASKVNTGCNNCHSEFK
jgi:hypothetical protein